MRPAALLASPFFWLGFAVLMVAASLTAAAARGPGDATGLEIANARTFAAAAREASTPARLP
jgi:hypothetical protein